MIGEKKEAWLKVETYLIEASRTMRDKFFQTGQPGTLETAIDDKIHEAMALMGDLIRELERVKKDAP